MVYRLSRVRLNAKKVQRMRLPIIPTEFLGDFVRGYFDGDGNVWIGKINKQRAMPTLVLLTAFTSSSHGHLKSMHKSLRDAGLQGGSLYKSKIKNFSRLSFSVNDSMKLYKIMYNGPHRLFLMRKKRVFERFVKMRW